MALDIIRDSVPEPQQQHDDAAAAWSAGEYERCLHLCSTVTLAHDPRFVEHALLRARALLRLGRPADVPVGLQPLLGHDDDGVRLSARGLIGTARVRMRDEGGVRALQDALDDAATAAPAVRSEIAIGLALAHYANTDYQAAVRALDLVDRDSDISYARALEYRGWVATALGDQEAATRWFAQALEAIDGCRQRDRYLEANCTQALAALALERFDRAAWAEVVRRRAELDWSADSLHEHRFFIALRAAVFAYDVEGDPLQAAWEARCAEEWAPTDAFRVQALCCRAQIARKARESVSQRNHVEAARCLFEGIRGSLGDGDALIVMLVLAEELSNAGAAADAREMFSRYRNHSRMSPLLSMAHDPRLVGFETLVEAQILEAEGRVREAVGAYREAFRFFSGIRSLRRSLTAAVRLTRLSPDDATVRDHVETVAAEIAKGSWIAPLAEGLRRAGAARWLSPAQRTYLTLLCDGKSNPEIARVCNRSVHTVRNQVAVLFDIFGVQSRAELVALCARLGILDVGRA